MTENAIGDGGHGNRGAIATTEDGAALLFPAVHDGEAIQDRRSCLALHEDDTPGLSLAIDGTFVGPVFTHDDNVFAEKTDRSRVHPIGDNHPLTGTGRINGILNRRPHTRHPQISGRGRTIDSGCA